MKKTIKFFALVLVAALVVTFGTKTITMAKGGSVKSVTITKPTKKSTLTITRKDTNVTKQLKVNVKTTGSASKAVTYKSSNKKVATVSSTGLITAKKKGTATITVTSKANKKKKDTLKITVKQAVAGVTASVKKPLATYKNVTTLVKGRTYTISTKIAPSNANNKKVSYKSSKPSVAKVTSAGKISAKKPGTAKITVTAKDGSKKKTTFTVYVTKKITSKATSVTAKADKDTLKIGETAQITATIAPSDATCKKVAYGSSNEKVATVDATTGKVKAVALGTATITVKALDGSKKTAKVKITVKEAVTKVTFKKDAKVVATVKFTDKNTLESDVTTLLAQSGLNDGSTKQVTINGRSYAATYKDKKLKFDGKSISDVTKDAATVEVTVGANASKFMAGIQLASFATGTYNETVTVGNLTFTELKTGASKSSVKIGNKTYEFEVKNGSVYFSGDVAADLAGLAHVADIVVE